MDIVRTMFIEFVENTANKKWFSSLKDSQKIFLVKEVLDLSLTVEEIDNNISSDEIKELYRYKSILSE